MSQKISVSIIGVTGFTGIELLKLLHIHPNVEVTSITSQSHNGMQIEDLYPHLQGCMSYTISKTPQASDVTFLTLPHTESQKIVPLLIGKTKIIDLSGDFRIKDPKIFEHYYNHTHSCHQLTDQFVYGLPELNTQNIQSAQNIANPGCFAITTQLALLPIKTLINNLVVQGITGSSGSGKNPKPGVHHAIRNHNLSSYKINSHQHIPEILQTIPVENFSFIPTSGPFTRGIHITATATLSKNIDALKAFTQFYQNAAFIRIKDQVQLAEVVGSNFCDLSITQSDNSVIIQAACDNLLKGAAGTAIHNFNLMNQLPETTGLETLIPLFP